MPDQKKYRMTALISSHMFRDEALDFTARGILGYVSTMISGEGHPAITAEDIPAIGTTRKEISEVLDLLVELDYMEVVK